MREERLEAIYAFPRTRGDGPDAIFRVSPTKQFPPHSRGWTRPRPLHAALPAVSPALAGMDPAREDGHNAARSFPRTRGDGPRPHSAERLHVGFPPHSRGWTPDPELHGGPGDVSPALAGMDPAPTGFTGRRIRFPRTRGDGPAVALRHWFLRTFPPHSRGWTAPLVAPGLVGHVSPALAGMDPQRSWTTGNRRRFPRTRGDGPGWGSDVGQVLEFPPHSRGWTPVRIVRRSIGLVSPALAGMDPHPRPGS